MLKYLKAVTVLLFLSPSTYAAFTDFEDLTNGTLYGVGDTIESNGLTFEPVSSTVRVRGPDPLGVDAGGSGLELRIGGSASVLSFTLPNGTSELSFVFGAYDQSAAFVVNGVSAQLEGNFAALNGSMVGGVEVSVIPSAMPPFGIQNAQGKLVLSGNINSLLLHGPELSIDDVLVTIPEPAPVALATSALLNCLMRSRIRRRPLRAT